MFTEQTKKEKEKTDNMEMVIDFPGGSRVDAHFGTFTVQTEDRKSVV